MCPVGEKKCTVLIELHYFQCIQWCIFICASCTPNVFWKPDSEFLFFIFTWGSENWQWSFNAEFVARRIKGSLTHNNDAKHLPNVEGGTTHITTKRVTSSLEQLQVIHLFSLLKTWENHFTCCYKSSIYSRDIFYPVNCDVFVTIWTLFKWHMGHYRLYVQLKVCKMSLDSTKDIEE